jgi:Lamin Tail Domain
MFCRSTPSCVGLLNILIALWISAQPGKAELIISEFLASNIKNLADEDGAFEDWIEIRNTGTERASLAGWFLSDSSNDLRKWPFPGTNVNAGSSLVVFASNKDRREIGKPLHTNFKLSQTGEFLALTKPDGITSTTRFSPAYPAQIPDISYGFGLVTTNFSLISSTSSRRVLVPSELNGGSAIGDAWKGGAEPFNDSSWTAASGGVGYSGDDATLVGVSDLAIRLNFDAAPAGTVILDTKPLGTPRNGINNKSFWLASGTDRAANPISRAGVTQFAATNASQITVPANADFNGASGTLSFWILSAGNIDF